MASTVRLHRLTSGGEAVKHFRVHRAAPSSPLLSPLPHMSARHLPASAPRLPRSIDLYYYPRHADRRCHSGTKPCS